MSAPFCIFLLIPDVFVDKNEGFPVLRTYPVRVSLHAGTRQKYYARVQQKILSNTDRATFVAIQDR